MIIIIKGIADFIWWASFAMVTAGILLILLRSLFNYTDANPFKSSVRMVRRSTDPVLGPIRRMLISVRIDPSVAPFIAVLAMIVAGYLLVEVSSTVLNTIAGVVYAVTSGRTGMMTAIIGYLIFGLLGLYTLAIFVRILFLWISVGYGNRFMRFLFRLTEPLLAPLRRSIRPVGMFDVSPIVAFLILWLCQIMVARTLLRGWTTRFF
jgi:YggT family protein